MSSSGSGGWHTGGSSGSEDPLARRFTGQLGAGEPLVLTLP